jgi:tRNA pseudouridine32 synthase/23S rRNA pseudouridine746 synthase
MPLEEIHCDDRLAAFNKPAGLLSVPGIGPANQDCLARRAARRHPGALIVHRLDAETSGVIVLARDPEAHRELSRQFHDREVEKVYVAVVAGEMANDEGVIDLPMRKDIDNRPLSVVDHAQGKPSVTRWRVLDRKKGSDPFFATRLELRPLTGRSHQLRVHLAAIGHPILGDSLYAPTEARFAAPRLMLHALSLTVTHPGNGQRLTFTAPCPF